MGNIEKSESRTLDHAKCLFISGPTGRDELFLTLSKELETTNKIDSTFLSLAHGSEDYFAQNGVLRNKIFSVDFEKEYPSLNVEYLEAKEKEYGFKLLDMWHVAAIRKKRRRQFSSEKVLRILEYHLRSFEKILSSNQFDYAFIIGISEPRQVMIYKMLIAKGIPVLELVNARIPGRFTFDDALLSKWPMIFRKYEELKKVGLSDEARQKAMDFVSAFRDKPFKPDDSAPKKWNVKKVAKQLQYYAKVFSYRKRLPDLRQWIYTPFMDKALLHSSRFEMPVDGEKYVFFPLQTQPEASTSVKGKWFMDQIDLIEKISKSVPCGYKVYVKEHVWNYSRRPSDFHKKIKEFPNVRLISPKAKTIEVIKKSSLVFTITGTVGWEAVLLQKPVIVFGEVYYAHFDVVKRLFDLTQLPEATEELLDSEMNLDDVLVCVSSMIQGSYIGIAALPGDCQNRSLAPDNMKLIAKGVQKYVAALE